MEKESGYWAFRKSSTALSPKGQSQIHRYWPERGSIAGSGLTRSIGKPARGMLENSGEASKQKRGRKCSSPRPFPSVPWREVGIHLPQRPSLTEIQSNANRPGCTSLIQLWLRYLQESWERISFPAKPVPTPRLQASSFSFLDKVSPTLKRMG